MTLKIAPCTGKAARYAVEHWHYSGRMPAPPCACFGVWEHDHFIGAVIFSPGASPQIFRQFGLEPREVTELTRVALRDHDAPVSKIITQAVGALKRSSTGLKLIISFADPYHGHRGGIYQAMNWIYLGRSDASLAYKDPMTGRQYHSRVVSNTGWRKQFGQQKRVRTASSLIKIKMPGKHRYALPLTKSVRRKLIKVARPYPAVEVSDGDTPGVLPGEAGSIPADRSRS